MNFTDLLEYMEEGTGKEWLLLTNCATMIQIEEDPKSFRILIQLMTTDPDNLNKTKELLQSKGLAIVENSIEIGEENIPVDITRLWGPVNFAIALIHQLTPGEAIRKP